MYQLKDLIISSLYHLKFFDILRQFQKKRVIILMYHRFSQKPEPFKIQQSIFENQIKFLKKKYNFISLKHYSEVLNEKRDDLPDNPIIITIDDGYLDNYVFAYPVLKKYSVPATIFLTTDFLSKKSWLWSNKLEYILRNSQKKKFRFELADKTKIFDVSDFPNWHKTQLAMFNFCRMISDSDKDLFLTELSKKLMVDIFKQTTGDFQPLTWEQVIEMKQNNIDFGSHTCSHPILSEVDAMELENEVVNSKNEIERKLNTETISFCYPNGQPDDINCDVIDRVRKAGYKCAVTTIKGANCKRKTNKFMLKRKSISKDSRNHILKEITRFF